MIANYGRGKRSLAQAYKVTVPGLEFAQIPPFIPSKLHQIESPEAAIGNAGLANQVSKNTTDASTGTDTQEKKDESTGTEDAKDNSSASKNTTSTGTSTEEQKDQSESVGTDSVENVDASTDAVTNEDASSATNDNDEKKNEKNDEKPEPVPESFADTPADISLKASVASTAAGGASFFLEKLEPYIPNPQEAVYLPQTFEEKYPNLNEWFERNKGNPEAIRRMENQIQTLEEQENMERIYKTLYGKEAAAPLSVQDKLTLLNDVYGKDKAIRGEIENIQKSINELRPGDENFWGYLENYNNKLQRANELGTLSNDELVVMKREIDDLQNVADLLKKDSTLLAAVKGSGKTLSALGKVLGGIATAASIADDAYKENDPTTKAFLILLDVLGLVAEPEIAVPATIIHFLWPESLNNQEKNEFIKEEKEFGDILKSIGSLEQEKEKAKPELKHSFNPQIHKERKEFNDAVDKHLKKLEDFFKKRWPKPSNDNVDMEFTSPVSSTVSSKPPDFYEYKLTGKENKDVQKLVARRDVLRQLKF